ncbi:hypothetical protein CWATWH0402_4992 [Crocosphaera watsonii WH 0402]|uniref:Uncharacterized protein n=1 Tax=Crocosphaera watsonii WH 0402 TaxID=1284629 RepID=T2JZQ6_CROWT|nr:hypothetical protein CWATWH0402_4992 [Crocosphaera watsonii WH 0402]
MDGSTITNLEGSSLDADGDGIAGGIQTFSFTTVSLEPIPQHHYYWVCTRSRSRQTALYRG